MASGSLPPGFPATEIDGEYYWDGGLVSNTPLLWVLENKPRLDTLAFQVDLWNARGEPPRDITEVEVRHKEIVYSSRTRAATDEYKYVQKRRIAFANLLKRMPDELRNSEEAKLLIIYVETGVSMRLQDKVAIVTGAASGIGKGIATLFAREGAKVAIADLNQKAADAVARELDATGKRAIGVAMDVTDERQVEDGTAKVIDTFGALDVLVSNAGIQIVAPLVDFEFAKWKQLLAIHLDGGFLTTRAALRQMYKQKRGSVIYMGSVHSKEASVLKAPYVTAKHGLIGLAKVVAKEGAAHGVRANVICPGFVRTPLVDKQIPEQAKVLGISEQDVIKKVMLKDTVDGEFTTMQDVAETALFLASFESNALTGQSIVVSHGWSMQ
jgi:3-hydroxybutyrate dehydrogenase